MFKKHLLASACVLAFASAPLFSSPQILLEEDFESYSGETEFSTVWPKIGNAVTHLAADPENEENTVLFSKGDRRTRTFASATPTDDEPLYFRIDYYDAYEPGVPAREYAGLWASPFDHGNRLIEVGLHPTASGATDRYAARIFGSEHGAAWFDLNTARSEGWHQIELLVFEESVEIYIDGELDTVADWVGGALGAVRLGFGAGSGDTASLTGVYYDNLQVERVEAPGGQGTLIELSGFSSRPEASAFALPN